MVLGNIVLNLEIFQTTLHIKNNIVLDLLFWKPCSVLEYIYFKILDLSVSRWNHFIAKCKQSKAKAMGQSRFFRPKVTRTLIDISQFSKMIHGSWINIMSHPKTILLQYKFIIYKYNRIPRFICILQAGKFGTPNKLNNTKKKCFKMLSHLIEKFIISKSWSF
jgi:hypothetical protein